MKGNPVDETTPGDPEGPLSSSTLTGWVDDTESTERPPTCLAPRTVTSWGATVNMATGRLPPSTVTVTRAGDVPGLATAKLSMVAPAVPGALVTPGPGTSQPWAMVTVPEDDPHAGGLALVDACTERPTTIGADAATETEYGTCCGTPGVPDASNTETESGATTKRRGKTDTDGRFKEMTADTGDVVGLAR